MMRVKKAEDDMLAHNRSVRGLPILAVLTAFIFSTPSIGEEPATGHQPSRRNFPTSANDPCIVYSYDASGTRLSQTVAVSGGAMTPSWGTGSWGCFTWTQQ